MKPLCLLIVCLFSSASVVSQIIDIPDAEFKNALVNTNCSHTGDPILPLTDVDTNDDGEIQLSEALAIEYLYVGGQGISSMTGIENFQNLLELNCSDNQLTELSLVGLTNIRGLNCSSNLLTSLDVNMLPNLTNLQCQHNQLTNLSLNISTLGSPNNYDLNCSYNNLTTLDLKSNAYYEVLANNNQLTSINYAEVPIIYLLSIHDNAFAELTITGPTILRELYVGNPQMTSFSIAPNTNMRRFGLINTEIVHLDFSGNSFDDSFAILNNPLLETINLKDGRVNFDYFAAISFTDNPLLQVICVDDLSASYDDDEPGGPFYKTETQQINGFGTGNGLPVTTYCTLTPGGNYNTIQGNITFNCNNNGLPAQNVNLQVTQTNGNNTTTGETYSNTSGSFVFYGGNGNTTITPQFENPYFNVSPASHNYNFTTGGNIETADFCVTANGIHPDLEITFIPMDAARPGFDATYKVVLTNKGTETQSGAVQLSFDDAVMDFVSATPNLTASSIGLLTWDFDVLAPFQTTDMTVVFNINSPMETPAVNDGDILTFTANAISGTDETPDDNMFELLHTVVNSFDPNDKLVSETSITDVDGFLYYTIRFQNTGTFAAENVVVKDWLSDKLDWTTLEMVSASHPYRSALTENNKLEFFFENIDLPASIDNEPASHGYVTFKIKPKGDLTANDVIQNSAGIYFDFNFPIITNTVTTTLAPLAIQTFANKQWFSMYPNPANSILNLKSEVKINSIDVINHLGQTISTTKNVESIDVSKLASGVYFVRANSDRGTSVQKFIKL